MKTFYCKVPSLQSAFKVNEDCCYEQVIYGGTVIGVTSKNDSPGDALNSHDLICDICNPKLKIIPISRQEYYSLVEDVNTRRKAAS